MRQVKFRGKASNILYNGADILHHKGDWLYGDLIHQGGKCFICEPDKRFPLGTDFMSFSVEPDTVGQSTGLTDRNGVDIYEGDIISGSNGSVNGTPWVFQKHIRWIDAKCMFNVPLWNYDKDAKYYENSSTHWFAVIGNIHDNPEIITKNEE